MELENRIEAFARLGKFFRQFKQTGSIDHNPDSLNSKYFKPFESAIQNAFNNNPWFVEKFVRQAVTGIGESIKESTLQKWMEKYPELKVTSKKPISVGVVMAGNIPLVGFHDFMSVLISGNKFTGKLSSKDNILLPIIAKILSEIYPPFRDIVRFTDQLNSDYDAFIATGSSNTARYFNYYFRNIPNIIRKNRNSVAILDGSESREELQLLGDDIFRYFGLGCRSISKLYVPDGYDFMEFINAIEPFKFVIDHSKYANNYKYNRTILKIDEIRHMDNGFVLLKQDEPVASPIGVINFQHYNNNELLKSHLENIRDNIQCIVSRVPFFNAIPPGKAQEPEVWEYADNIDTINFLLSNR